MIYVFLANGFEEIEALTPVDFLRRAGIDVKTVGVSGKICVGTHGVKVEADILPEDVVLDGNLRGIVLPGGMPGADNLDRSATVQKAIDYCFENGKLISAICAAPFILGKKGVLKGKRATCFPGFEKYLDGAETVGESVVTDDTVITAKGAGVAWEFSEAIAEKIIGEEKSVEILGAVQWQK